MKTAWKSKYGGSRGEVYELCLHCRKVEAKHSCARRDVDVFKLVASWPKNEAISASLTFTQATLPTDYDESRRRKPRRLRLWAWTWKAIAVDNLIKLLCARDFLSPFLYGRQRSHEEDSETTELTFDFFPSTLRFHKSWNCGTEKLFCCLLS